VGPGDVLQAGSRKRRIRIHHNFFISRVDSSDEEVSDLVFGYQTPILPRILSRLEIGD
jgi:hypothetical protein